MWSGRAFVFTLALCVQVLVCGAASARGASSSAFGASPVGATQQWGPRSKQPSPFAMQPIAGAALAASDRAMFASTLR